MNFNDKNIREQVELAEKQIDGIRKILMEHVKDNDIDPRVTLAAIISLITYTIAGEAGTDPAKQDACVAFILKGIYVSLAENGFRPFDETMEDSIPPWEKN